MSGKHLDRTAIQAAIGFACDDLASFATLMHRRFEFTRHHRLIIEQLERVERGEIDRLMLALPPRHGQVAHRQRTIPGVGSRAAIAQR
jgi:hypothetical protein